MAKRSGSNSISYWGQYATATGATGLPNVAGGTFQPGPFLEAGDIAYVTGTAKLYVCTTPTAGAAVWAVLSSSLTQSSVWNLNGDLSFAVLAAAAGTVSTSALFDGTRTPPVACTITNVVLTQQVDGTAGTTTVELYRRRAGANTLLATLSIAFGGGDYAQTTAVPAGALATVNAGDIWIVQPTAVQTEGINVSLEVQFTVP